MVEVDLASSKEEEDLLEHSQRRSKEQEAIEIAQSEEQAVKGSTGKAEQRRSYRDSLLGYGNRYNIRGEELDDGEVSDDDIIVESSDGSWI